MNLRNKKTKELIKIALEYTTLSGLSRMMTTIGLEDIRYRKRKDTSLEFTFCQHLEIVRVINNLIKEKDLKND